MSNVIVLMLSLAAPPDARAEADSLWLAGQLARVQSLWVRNRPQEALAEFARVPWNQRDRLECRLLAHELFRRDRHLVTTEPTGAVAFSPDGSTIVGRCGAALVGWDARTGTEVFRHPVEGKGGVAVSADGRRIGVGVDGGVRVIDARTGATLQKLEGRRRDAVQVVLTADGSRVLGGGVGFFHGGVSVWDAADGRQLHHFPGEWSVTASADGTRVASLTDAGIRVWDTHTGETIRLIPLPKIHPQNTAALSPDGLRVACWTATPGPGVWSVTTGERVFDYVSHELFAGQFAWTADGETVVSAFASGLMQAFWVDYGFPSRTHRGGTPISDIAAGPNGTLAVAGPGGVQVWHTRHDWTDLPPPEREFAGIAQSPDGSQIAAESREGDVHLIDASAGEGRHRVRLRIGGSLGGETSGLTRLAFSADGSRVLNEKLVFPTVNPAATPGTPSFASGVLRLSDTRTGHTLRVFTEYADHLQSFAISPDNARVVGARAGRIIVWDAHTGRVVRTFGGGDEDDTMIVISANARYAVGGPPGHLEVWDTETGKRIADIPTGEHAARHLAISPDGNTVATADLWGELRAFDVRTGRRVISEVGLYFGTQALAFTPDGSRLVSASVGRIRLWEVATGVELLRISSSVGLAEYLEGVTPEVKAVCVSGGSYERLLPTFESGTLAWSANPIGEPIEIVNPAIRWFDELVTEVGFTADDRQIWYRLGEGRVAFHDAVTGEMLRLSKETPPGPVRRVSRDGTREIAVTHGRAWLRRAGWRPTPGRIDFPADESPAPPPVGPPSPPRADTVARLRESAARAAAGEWDDAEARTLVAPLERLAWRSDAGADWLRLGALRSRLGDLKAADAHFALGQARRTLADPEADTWLALHALRRGRPFARHLAASRAIAESFARRHRLSAALASVGQPLTLAGALTLPADALPQRGWWGRDAEGRIRALWRAIDGDRGRWLAGGR